MAAELDSTSAAPVLTVLVIIMLLGSFNLQRRCYNNYDIIMLVMYLAKLPTSISHCSRSCLVK